MLSFPPYQIIIAEDQLIVAEGLSVLLQQDSDFKVMAIAENGEKLLQLLNEKSPHLILLDLNMPIVNGIEACQKVRQKFPGIVVVALTSYDDNKVRHRVKAAGAAGMLPKHCSSKELADKLRLIMKNGNDGSFFCEFGNANNEPPPTQFQNDKFLLEHKISEREMEIIRLIAEGCNSEEIAKRLYLSDHTIKTHRRNILDKLNLKNTAELINFIHQNNLM